MTAKMPSCRECKHWVEQGDLPGGPAGLHGPSGNEFRCCAMTLFEGDGPQPGLATARDASGYMAILFTRAEFGCVQFEAADPPAG